jgi:hypothetical protein
VKGRVQGVRVGVGVGQGVRVGVGQTHMCVLAGLARTIK